MKLDAKTIYAQSSDIKSRTYLEYRRDMKKKAIVELEIVDWIKTMLKNKFKAENVRVYKSGGDKFLWFLRKGGISRDPDFIAEIDNEKKEIEFQYVDANINSFYFNFKTTKLLKKNRKTKEFEKKQILFLCLLKQTKDRYAILNTEWILNNANKTNEVAWGKK